MAVTASSAAFCLCSLGMLSSPITLPNSNLVAQMIMDGHSLIRCMVEALKYVVHAERNPLVKDETLPVVYSPQLPSDKSLNQKHGDYEDAVHASLLTLASASNPITFSFNSS